MSASKTVARIVERHTALRAELAQAQAIGETAEFPVEVAPVTAVSVRKYKDREHVDRMIGVFEAQLAKRASELRKRGYVLETDASVPVAPPENPTTTETPANATEQTIEAKIAELEATLAEAQNKPEFAKRASAIRGQITRLRKQLPTSAPHAA